MILPFFFCMSRQGGKSEKHQKSQSLWNQNSSVLVSVTWQQQNKCHNFKKMSPGKIKNLLMEEAKINKDAY